MTISTTTDPTISSLPSPSAIASRRLALPDKRLSDSRVTLLTGVHRKDVKRSAMSLGADVADDLDADDDIAPID